MIFKKLLEGTKYENDAGGDPQFITDLTYEEFVKFAKDFYHPSNCNFISYGDLDFRNHIDYLEITHLKNYERKDFSQNIGKPIISRPNSIIIKGPTEAMKLKENYNASASLNFLLDKIDNEIDYLGLNILTLLFFEFPSSPFYKIFLET